jgi:hypothetical protein
MICYEVRHSRSNEIKYFESAKEAKECAKWDNGIYFGKTEKPAKDVIRK